MPKPNALDRFIKFYENFEKFDLSSFNKVYDQEVFFQDPFHEIKGAENLLEYFQNMMKKTSNCRFNIKETHCDNNSASVIWEMYFRHPQIKSGKEICVQGSTHIRFHDKVTYHRDYFDSSELIYRNIPILGSVLRFIERRM